MNYNIDNILNRNEIKNNIISILKNYNNDENNKKGIFIHGNNGSGKTFFVKNLLNENGMDYIYFDGTDIRSSNFIENLYENNSSNMNVISLFNKNPKTIIIIVDDIDSINSSDKTTLTNLIKLVRQKKTKKQKLEHKTNSPVIFIANKNNEKKILDLMKVCNVFKIDSPNNNQIELILNNYISHDKNKNYIKIYFNKFIDYFEYNFHKIFNLINIINDPDFNIQLINQLINNISISKNVKNLTKDIINNKYIYTDNIISDNDKTIVGLLYHENIIDILSSTNKEHVNLYYEFLENYSKTDFIDRIIYQKQIWQLNDLNFIIKILKNNLLIHNFKKTNNLKSITNNIRFTKILTKYSTEYNNTTFLNNICNELGYNIKDTFNYFIFIFQTYNENDIIKFLQNYNISDLDINRIYKIIKFHYIF